MLKGQYVGCTTGFSQSDKTDIFIPNQKVNANATPYLQRLVAVNLVRLKDESRIVCTPTRLSFVPKVVIPEGKKRVILRVALYVNGEQRLNLNGNFEFIDLDVSLSHLDLDENTPEAIARYLFLFSGIDLLRQHHVQDYFDYSPRVDFDGGLTAGMAIEIAGRALPSSVPSDLRVMSEVAMTTFAADCELRFLLVDDLPEDAVDFAWVQWGHEVSVHSCAYQGFLMG